MVVFFYFNKWLTKIHFLFFRLIFVAILFIIFVSLLLWWQRSGLAFLIPYFGRWRAVDPDEEAGEQTLETLLKESNTQRNELSDSEKPEGTLFRRKSKTLLILLL